MVSRGSDRCAPAQHARRNNGRCPVATGRSLYAGRRARLLSRSPRARGWCTLVAMTEAPEDLPPLTRAEAVGAGWEDGETGCGAVTRAYDEWVFVEKDQRRFLHQTLAMATQRYDAVWEQVKHEPAWDGGPDAIDVFYERIGGLMPHDFEWMALAAVLRDAVTAYEVYLGKAIDEVLQRHGRPREKQDRTPGWPELEQWCRVLGLTPRPSVVHETVSLRDILTHKRGELRTDRDRERFANTDEPFASSLAHLTEEAVFAHMDGLGANVRELDPVMWAYSWGRHVMPALLPGASKQTASRSDRPKNR